MTELQLYDEMKSYVKSHKSNCQRGIFAAFLVDVERSYPLIFKSADYRIISTGHSMSDNLVCSTRCNRVDGRPGKGYDKCSAVHAEEMTIFHALRSGVPILSKLYLYVYGADNEGNYKEAINPCRHCAAIIKYFNLKGVISHDEEMNLIKWDGISLYGGDKW